MLLHGFYQVFLVGFFGGIVLELLHWYSLRRKPSFPQYARSAKYWAVTLAMAAVGGLLALLYFGDRAEGIIALHVGLSAPLILQKLVTTIATTPGGKGGDASIVSFFQW